MTTRQTMAAAALFALNMAIACTITYAIITHVLAPFVDKSDDLLGGMWAVVATVFVFRDTRVRSLSAGTFVTGSSHARRRARCSASS